MRQLDDIKAGTLEWHDVPEPRLSSAKAALVRPLVVSTCDMDGVVISGVAPFKGPLPVGHEGDIPFPVFSMYRRSVTFHTGWVHTRDRAQDGSRDGEELDAAL